MLTPAPIPDGKLFEDEYHRSIAIPALQRELGYQEIFSDSDERYQSDFDSIGLRGETPCFIEVKLHVRAAEADHLIVKLHNGIHAYETLSDRSPFALAMRQVCPSGQVPLFGVIALSYGSGALRNLKGSLAEQAERLQVAWHLWTCSPTELLTSIDADESRLAQVRHSVVLERRKSLTRINRRPRPSLGAHEEAAERAGFGALYCEALSRLDQGRAQLTARGDYVSGKSGGFHVRLYSSLATHRDGLLIGVDKVCRSALERAGLTCIGFGDFGLPDFRIHDSDTLRTFFDALRTVDPPRQQ